MAVMGNDATIINDLRDLVAELSSQNVKLAATVKAQTAQIADLMAKLAAANKNSFNSSKPPSSDFFKCHKPHSRIGGIEPGGVSPPGFLSPLPKERPCAPRI